MAFFRNSQSRQKGRAGQSGNKPGSGPEGDCVCPACGHRTPHQRGIPCMTIKCPKCGTTMVKE